MTLQNAYNQVTRTIAVARKELEEIQDKIQKQKEQLTSFVENAEKEKNRIHSRFGEMPAKSRCY